MFRLTAVALSLACLTAFATQATAGEKHVAVGFATYDAHHPTPVVEVKHGPYGHGHGHGYYPGHRVYYPAPVVVRRPVVVAPPCPHYAPYPVYRPYGANFYYSGPGVSIGIGY